MEAVSDSIKDGAKQWRVSQWKAANGNTDDSLSCQVPIICDCLIFAGATGPPNAPLFILRSRIGCQVEPETWDPISLLLLKCHFGREEETELLHTEHRKYSRGYISLNPHEDIKELFEEK